MRKSPPTIVRSCTNDFKGYPPLLYVPVHVGLPFKPSEKPIDPIRRVKGIWDTGASISFISEAIAKEFDLKPIGMERVGTAGGMRNCYTYLISIGLPNNVVLSWMRVASGSLGDLDILVGMDVMREGDFAVTNCKGTTVCS